MGDLAVTGSAASAVGEPVRRRLTKTVGPARAVSIAAAPAPTLGPRSSSPAPIDLDELERSR